MNMQQPESKRFPAVPFAKDSPSYEGDCHTSVRTGSQ